ncbi:menaquinone-dependent protoporphyrinogen IX dehydrogenase [Saezia sanguinis]|nr:menaquinone-dependent protoporphyrinogen IX dehydrogenase [Saezia sanguinis]
MQNSTAASAAMFLSTSNTAPAMYQDISYAPVLLLYSSRFGQSRTIAERLAGHLNSSGHICTLQNIEKLVTLAQPLDNYAAIVIVASIRYGHFHRRVKAFVQQNLAALNQKLSVFVPVCLIARRQEKRQIETNSYTRKLLAKTGWKPSIISITAGALRYPIYNFFDRFMVRLIMVMMKGDTDTSREYEYTDWEQVHMLAQQIHQQLGTQMPQKTEQANQPLSE